MRQRLLPASFLVAVCLGSLAPAQDRVVVMAHFFQSSTNAIYEVSPAGAILATVLKWPWTFSPSGCVMAADNQAYRVFGNLTAFPMPRYGVVFEYASGGASSLVALGPASFRPTDMLLTCDGDWLALSPGYTAGTPRLDVWRLRQGRLTTLSAVKGFSYRQGSTLDPESGQLVVRGQMSPSSHGYYRVDPPTGTVTTLATFSPYSARYGVAHTLPFDGASGAFLDVIYDYQTYRGKLMRIHSELGLQTVSTHEIAFQPYDLVRATGRGQAAGYYAAHQLLPTYLRWHAIDRLAADGRVLTSNRIRGATMSTFHPILRKGSRHLAWRMVAPPNGRRLELSFPGEPGRPYRVVMSLRGLAPGFALGDGRVVPIVPDGLTWLCLGGGVPGILHPTVGQLDATGRATVTVDTNRAGSALRGLRIWVAALVLDASAPRGVARIVGPSRLALR